MILEVFVLSGILNFAVTFPNLLSMVNSACARALLTFKRFYISSIKVSKSPFTKFLTLPASPPD